MSLSNSDLWGSRYERVIGACLNAMELQNTAIAYVLLWILFIVETVAKNKRPKDGFLSNVYRLVWSCQTSPSETLDYRAKNDCRNIPALFWPFLPVISGRDWYFSWTEYTQGYHPIKLNIYTTRIAILCSQYKLRPETRNSRRIEQLLNPWAVCSKLNASVNTLSTHFTVIFFATNDSDSKWSFCSGQRFFRVLLFRDLGIVASSKTYTLHFRCKVSTCRKLSSWDLNSIIRLDSWCNGDRALIHLENNSKFQNLDMSCIARSFRTCRISSPALPTLNLWSKVFCVQQNWPPIWFVKFQARRICLQKWRKSCIGLKQLTLKRDFLDNW